MSNAMAGVYLVPGIVALVFLLVVTYLQRQTREAQFHAWQLAWASYLSHFIFRSMFEITGQRHWWLMTLALMGVVPSAVQLAVRSR